MGRDATENPMNPFPEVPEVPGLGSFLSLSLDSPLSLSDSPESESDSLSSSGIFQDSLWGKSSSFCTRAL